MYMSANEAAPEPHRAGGQGRVFLSTYSGRDTVTKIIPARLKGAADSEVRAVKRHQNKHIHVVTVYTAFTGTPCSADAAALPVGAAAANDVVLVMERCLADMHDVLLQNKAGIGESTFVREWVMQLAHAVRFLHARGIAHRDIKPENVLISAHGDSQRSASHGGSEGNASSLPPSQASASEPNSAAASSAGGTPRGITPRMQAQLAAIHESHRQELFSLVHTANKRNAIPDPTAYRSAVKQIRNRFVTKLCDFGSASVQSSSAIGREPITGHSPCGSRRFACPHVVLVMDMLKRPDNTQDIWTSTAAHWDKVMEIGYSSTAADVWSFGMTLFAIVTGHMPFSVASVEDELYRRYLATEQPHVLSDPVAAPDSPVWNPEANPRLASPWKWPSSISLGLRHLLSRCLAVRPAERFTIDEILKHPWFEDPTWQPAVPAASSRIVSLPPIAGPGGVVSSSRQQPGAFSAARVPRSSPLADAALLRGGHFESDGKTEDEDGDVALSGGRAGRRFSNPRVGRGGANIVNMQPIQPAGLLPGLAVAGH